MDGSEIDAVRGRLVNLFRDVGNYLPRCFDFTDIELAAWLQPQPAFNTPV